MFKILLDKFWQREIFNIRYVVLSGTVAKIHNKQKKFVQNVTVTVTKNKSSSKKIC